MHAFRLSTKYEHQKKIFQPKSEVIPDFIVSLPKNTIKVNYEYDK